MAYTNPDNKNTYPPGQVGQILACILLHGEQKSKGGGFWELGVCAGGCYDTKVQGPYGSGKIPRSVWPALFVRKIVIFFDVPDLLYWTRVW